MAAGRNWVILITLLRACIVSQSRYVYVDLPDQDEYSAHKPSFGDGQNVYLIGMDVALTQGAASFAKDMNPGRSGPPPPSMGFADGPGGPYDFDPADNPPDDDDSQDSPQTNQIGQGQGIQSSPSGLLPPVPPISVQGPPAQSSQITSQVPQAVFDVDWPFLSNSASGTAINTGRAAHGQLQANGRSDTHTGPGGSSSIGNAMLHGHGVGLSGTQINTGQAETNDPDSSANSNNMFVNTLSAGRGQINGDSNTISRSGPNGNAFGSSSGQASGSGDDVQLTQIANSESVGQSSFGPSPYGPGPHSHRYKRALPAWTSFFGLNQDTPNSSSSGPQPSAPLILVQGSPFDESQGNSAGGGFNTITKYDPKTGSITQFGGGIATFLHPGATSASMSSAGSAQDFPLSVNATRQ